MSNEYSFRPNEYTLADRASQDDRAAFIVKTYLHLSAAVIAYIVLLTVLVMMPFTPALVSAMVGGLGNATWLLVLGGFMGISYVANSWASNPTSIGKQYAGLGLYVVGNAIITLPLVFMAIVLAGVGIVLQAAVITAVAFAALTAVVFFTRMKFSFLGPILAVSFIIAFGLIAASLLIGFDLGLLFIGAMLILATGAILYQTSNVLHEFYIGQHVAASLALFASVALLFWYVLQFVLAMTGRD